MTQGPLLHCPSYSMNSLEFSLSLCCSNKIGKFTSLVFEFLSNTIPVQSMVYCKEMSCKRENLQRLIKHDVTSFSNTSILNSMERFIRTVREMEDTILIPSRLLDLTVGDSQDKLQLEDKRGSVIKATLANVDLYRIYNIVNQIKVEVLWSQDHMNDVQNLEEDPVLLEKFIRARNSSSTSMHSVQSVCTSYNSEFDIVTENDSEAENEDSVTVAARSFKKHLHGLHHNIEKMILVAEYLILRYQTAINSQA